MKLLLLMGGITPVPYFFLIKILKFLFLLKIAEFLNTLGPKDSVRFANTALWIQEKLSSGLLPG